MTSRLECVTRLQDHAENEALPAEVRQDCKEAATQLLKAEGWFAPHFKTGGIYWPTEEAYQALGRTPHPFPPNLAAYFQHIEESA